MNAKDTAELLNIDWRALIRPQLSIVPPTNVDPDAASQTDSGPLSFENTPDSWLRLLIRFCKPTESDDDLSDKMWAANLNHEAQYTRIHRQTQGLKLRQRGVKAKEIAERIGVGVSSVYRWTKELREKQKKGRDAEIQRLREKGMTTRESGEKVDVDHTTVTAVLENSQMRKNLQEPESESEPAIESPKAETGEELEAAEPEIPETEEMPAEEEARPPEPIPDHIPNTAPTVMGAFTDTRTDASVGEWMTITDDSLSNELERELLTSAAAMCLLNEQMIWYQGEKTGAYLAGSIALQGVPLAIHKDCAV